MSSKIRAKSDFIKNVKNNFMEKFKGKTNFVAKDGVLLVLFKQEEECEDVRRRVKTVSSLH